MSFSTSVNISRDFGKTPDYIITANARQAVGKIVNQYSAGIHSFCLIGSYGTGKSSFVLALENCLLCLSLEKVDSQSRQLCGSITQRKENFITTV